MTASRPLVMLSHAMVGPMEPTLNAAGYDVARYWEHADHLAFLAGPGQQVEAIVHAGEFKLDPALLSQMPRLGLIACVSAGYDGVDVPWCRGRNIAVTHSAGDNADDVADFAVGLLIAAWRGIVELDGKVRAGGWNINDRMRPRPSLTGKKVGVVGLGYIGAAVARRMEAFRTTVSWWGPNPKESPWPMADSLLALARDSDILMVCARGDSQGLIDAKVIDAIGPQGCLVNISRGRVVDEDALIAALKDGRLGMAGLDVFWQEPTPAARWADVPNVVLAPHAAGSTTQAIPLMVAQCLENLRRFFRKEPLLSPITR